MKQYNKSIRGKLFHYFQERLRIKESTKGWWRCDCVFCGGKYSMGIHMEYSNVKCFKCEEKVDPIQLLMTIENFEKRADAYKFLSIQQEYEYFETNSIIKKEYKKVELPDGYHIITSGENLIARSARHYLKKRGFNIDNLAMKGVGYGTEGDYFGYIIFPFYRKGELIYYQGRLFMGAGPKMRNPQDEQFGIGKSQVVYNGDALYIYNRVYIVESITNSLTLGDAAAGINGKSISDQQFSTIMMAPCEKVVIVLDPDAFNNALELGMQMVGYKQVKVVKLPDEVDVNDIGKQKTLKFITSTKWQKYMDLFRLRINEKGSINTHYRRGPYQNFGSR